MPVVVEQDERRHAIGTEPLGLVRLLVNVHDSQIAIADQGRVGQECYVIESGQAEVFVGEEHLVTLGPGSMVGEMSLIDRRPRSATVVATTPMSLLAFDTKAFKMLLSEMPKAEERVHALLAARLKANLGNG